MEYFPKNSRKLVKNEQKWLKNLNNVPLDPLMSPGCLSTRRKRLFGTLWYKASLPCAIIRIIPHAKEHKMNGIMRCCRLREIRLIFFSWGCGIIGEIAPSGDCRIYATVALNELVTNKNSRVCHLYCLFHLPREYDQQSLILFSLDFVAGVT